MKNNLKKYLDYIPLIILLISAVILIWTVATSDILLVWKHYIGLTFLVITPVLFYLRHLYGVLFLGLTLFVGLLGLLSFSPAITTTSFGLGNSEEGITLLRFQPIFLLWIVIYFVISGRYFVGIASKKYWEEVKNNER
jgi:hypothetical protein